MDEFNLIVFSYYSNSSDKYKLADIPFTLTFSKQSNADVSGEILQGNISKTFETNKSGEYTIEKLKILSSGLFIFELYYRGHNFSALTTNFISNFVKTINIKVQPQININYPLELNYSCSGDDDLKFILPINVSLLDSKKFGFVGDSSKKSNPGSFILNLAKYDNYSFIVSSNTSNISSQAYVQTLKNTFALNSPLIMQHV